MTLLAAYNHNEASGDVLDVTGNGHGFPIGPTFGNSARTAQNVDKWGTGRALTGDFDDVVPGPAPFGQTANRTIMAWIWQTSIPTGWAWEWLVSSISSGAWGLLFLNGQWNIQARNSSTFARATATAPSTSTWHHMAGTYDGSNIKLYIDGTLSATTALTGPLRTDSNAFRLLDQIGASTRVDDVRVYDEARTQAQIASDMATPVTAVTGPNVYFSSGAQASGVYEMTTGGVLVQRTNLITIK